MALSPAICFRTQLFSDVRTALFVTKVLQATRKYPLQIQLS
jgi:hypothetical protein